MPASRGFAPKQPGNIGIMEIDIKHGSLSMESELIRLYKDIAEISGGIIRIKNDIDKDYVFGFLTRSINKGLILVALINGKIIGEIHAYTPDIYAFQHLLTDLTIVIDPKYQRKGIGRQLFEEFLRIVKEKFYHILRIELYVREHNTQNVKFYESLGFINEGRQKHKIYKSKSEFETPLHMAWFNPDYKG